MTVVVHVYSFVVEKNNWFIQDSLNNVCGGLKCTRLSFPGGGEGSAHLPVMLISHSWTLSWTFWYWPVCVCLDSWRPVFKPTFGEDGPDFSQRATYCQNSHWAKPQSQMRRRSLVIQSRAVSDAIMRWLFMLSFKKRTKNIVLVLLAYHVCS